MISQVYAREALQSLWEAKQRSILALIGIFVGIGSVIAMISVGTIAQHEALRQFQEMGTDILKVMHEVDYSKARKPQNGLDIGTARAIPRHCPDIAAVAPYTVLYGTLKYEGNKLEAPALGITEAFKALNKLRLTEGRFISDMDHFMYYCTVGVRIQEELRRLGVTRMVGTDILFKGRKFTIAGTLAPAAANNMRPYEVNEGILVPISTAMRLDREAGVQTILARTVSGGDHTAAADQITRYFRAGKRETNVRVQSSEELIQHMQKQMRMFTLLLGAIGSISLIVGGVGVMNVMLVSVSERKKEIGIRRALGASQRDIQGQFLVESVILCLVGGLLGIVLGVGAAYGVAFYSKWEFIIAYNAIAIGVGFSAAVGLFFGFYPARQAARLDPIEALRDA